VKFRATSQAEPGVTQDSGKGTLKGLAVDDGQLFTTRDNLCLSWAWEREPLVLATAAKDNALVSELLEAGAIVDARGNVRERTALMHAALSDNADSAKLLLEAGADIDAEDTQLHTPVDYAAENSVGVSKVIVDKLQAPMVQVTSAQYHIVREAVCHAASVLTARVAVGHADVQAAAGIGRTARVHPTD
jgi:hypothetical protein